MRNSPLCPDDRHDWEEVEIMHEVSEAPVSMDMHDRITYQRTRYELVTQRCLDCGQLREIDRDCTCEPTRPCRCGEDCSC